MNTNNIKPSNIEDFNPLEMESYSFRESDINKAFDELIANPDYKIIRPQLEKLNKASIEEKAEWLFTDKGTVSPQGLGLCGALIVWVTVVVAVSSIVIHLECNKNKTVCKEVKKEIIKYIEKLISKEVEVEPNEDGSCPAPDDDE